MDPILFNNLLALLRDTIFNPLTQNGIPLAGRSGTLDIGRASLGLKP